MNPSTKFTLFAVSLIFISLVSSISLYESLCKETKGDNLRCLKLLQPYPKVTSAKDYDNLSRFILEIAIEKAEKHHSQVEELFKKYPSSLALKKCASDYFWCVSQFNDALEWVGLHPEMASLEATGARNYSRSCRDTAAVEKQLVKIQPVISTLASDIDLLSEVASTSINHLFPS